jgi:acyl-ACP thioesterase
MAKISQIERNFRVRFAQIDGARVIFFPRYLEMIAETFPEVAINEFPFDLAIKFRQPNRLGDDIKMCLEQSADVSKPGNLRFRTGCADRQASCIFLAITNWLTTPSSDGLKPPSA